MALMQIDVVGAEPPQRRLDAFEEVLARQAAVVDVVRHREERLGGDHHLVARDAAQRVAQRLLGGAVRVDVGGVEEIDAEIERAATILVAAATSTVAP